MGIILDSSIIIAAERRGHTVREILEQVKAVQGEIEIGVSVVTIAELCTVPIVRKPKHSNNDGWSSSSDCRVTCQCIR